MEIILYYNHSDRKALTKDLTDDLSINNVYFKDEVNRSSPILSLTSNVDLSMYNYLYIPDLDRYYYINDIKYSKQHIYINCSIDVLMSFRSDILQLTTIINRSSSSYNLYLDDDKFKLLNYETIRTLKFPNGFTDQQLIMGVVGKGGGN